MSKYTELMKKSILLNSLTREEMNRYLSDGSFKISTYGKNKIIHFTGERCAKLEIILAGKVVVERIDQSGNLMTLAEFISDELLGGNLLFSKNPYYPMTITAKQPTVILEIKQERLFKLFTDHHDFLKSYLEFVSDHATLLGDRIKHYVNRTIRESIMSFLEYESKAQNSNHIILTMTKKALAEKIGVQRTSLSRELAKMKKDGLIIYDAKTITLLKKGY
ncbi:MAG TPA: Crp/Fnr family transcriptional regulator [Firmicutes bacterium]|nr:Crp/Fnr family transcriptional regulator [Bacillota bacterium]